MTMISSLMEKLAEMVSILRERFERGGYKSEIITGSVSPDHVPKVSSEEQDRISSLLEEKGRITKNIWAITQTPVEEDLDLLLMEGNYYYDIQNFRKAREKFEKVLRIDPENVKALINLGVTLEVLDEWEKALKHFQRALKIFGELGDKSGISECFINTGLCYEELGDQKRANELYEEGAKLCEKMGLHDQAKEYRSWIE
ncbi:MAG: tetratricopeptide repeat protein [Candidatus Wukongarchaeota archaeon]|nr:tetratricopeptide repeat protein [Candidatus Wukongarchaeota archaeon]